MGNPFRGFQSGARLDPNPQPLPGQPGYVAPKTYLGGTTSSGGAAYQAPGGGAGALSTGVSQDVAVSRQFQTIAVLNSAQVLPPNAVIIPLTTYSVSPNNPYFRIFGAGPTMTGTPQNLGFVTEFTFLNGGSFQSSYKLYWGDEAALDLYVGQMTIMIQPGPADVLYAHDPVSNTCPFALPGAVTNGACIRWTSLAGTVQVKTNLVNTVSTTLTSSGSIAQGLLQQLFN